jgi:hypothetical protein
MFKRVTQLNKITNYTLEKGRFNREILLHLLQISCLNFFQIHMYLHI